MFAMVEKFWNHSLRLAFARQAWQKHATITTKYASTYAARPSDLYHSFSGQQEYELCGDLFLQQ